MNNTYFFSEKETKRLLKKLIVPHEHYDSVEDIQLENLLKKGIDTLLIDVDNTLLAYAQRNLSLQKTHWIDIVKSMGFTVYFISNNSSYNRIARVSEATRCPALFFSLKPFAWTLREFAAIHYIDFRHTAIIGDQAFTDVALGNWLKMHTILVKSCGPLSWIKDIQHRVETALLNWLK